MVKQSRNFEKILKKLEKSFFFVEKKKENGILLVLEIEEISLRPELSRPPRFRIQGGSPERYGGGPANKGNPHV